MIQQLYSSLVVDIDVDDVPSVSFIHLLSKLLNARMFLQLIIRYSSFVLNRFFSGRWLFFTLSLVYDVTT